MLPIEVGSDSVRKTLELENHRGRMYTRKTKEANLMCVEGDSLQVSDQVPLRGRVGTLVGDITRYFVQLIA